MNFYDRNRRSDTMTKLTNREENYLADKTHRRQVDRPTTTVVLFRPWSGRGLPGTVLVMLCVGLLYKPTCSSHQESGEHMSEIGETDHTKRRFCTYLFFVYVSFSHLFISLFLYYIFNLSSKKYDEK